MKNLNNIIKSLNEIALRLAQDNDLQKLLIVDKYDIDEGTFTPLTPQQLFNQHYICMTAQTEDGIKKSGRNTFLILTLSDINFEGIDDNTSIMCNIYAITDINHTLIKNNQDRCLAIMNRIVQDLNGLKLSVASVLKTKYISRITYTETLGGYLLKISFNDQSSKEVEL